MPYDWCKDATIQGKNLAAEGLVATAILGSYWVSYL